MTRSRFHDMPTTTDEDEPTAVVHLWFIGDTIDVEVNLDPFDDMGHRAVLPMSLVNRYNGARAEWRAVQHILRPLYGRAFHGEWEDDDE